MKPLIICAALTGSAPPQSRTPYHPTTPDAVAAAAVAAWRAGAAMVHIHARLEDGTATASPEAYEVIIDKILAAGCDAIINVSAGDNGGGSSHDERLAATQTRAEMVSLAVGSFNLGNRLYDNSPSFVRAMATRAGARGMVPVLEVFDIGSLQLVQKLVAEGLLPTPATVEFVFGLPGGIPMDPDLLPLLIAKLPSGCEWMISSHTSSTEDYLRMAMLAYTQGGHVRTGMEDMVFLRPGELAKTNAELVEQWVKTAAIWGRPVASPAQARQMLGIV